jgi:IS5 family transposase
MTEEEKQWAGDVPSGIPVYADGRFPGAGTAEEAEECIKKGIWNNRDQKKKE